MQLSSRKKIFIVGCPRSGTTLLQQMLDAHPDVAIAPETHFMRLFWSARKEYGNLADDNNFRKLLEDITDLPEFHAMELDKTEFTFAAWSSIRNYATVFQLLLENFARDKNASTMGEKTPNHVLYLPQIQAFFPDAYFIHIVRDPRSVVNSWRTVPWSTGSITGDAEMWLHYVSAAWRKPPKVKDRIFTIYYENLVASPKESLQSLCEFIGLQFQPVMLAYHRKESKLVNIKREPWKEKSVQPVSQNSLMKWQSELSHRDIAEIETITWFEMKKHGYITQTHVTNLWPKVVFFILQRISKYFMKLANRNLKKLT